MTPSRAFLCLAVLALGSRGMTGAQTAGAQKPPAENPAAHNPHLASAESIRAGMMLYRVNCGDCHGLDAGGYRGPDLTAVLAGGATDERLYDTIRKGLPGTDMPAASKGMPDDEILQIIAYLRNLSTVAAPVRLEGNVENGQRLFASQCQSCHRVSGRGGRLGPDLTRIGAARSRAALTREIRTPSEWLAPGYETVTLVTKDGQRVRGTKKNDDVFSIQIMDTRERIQGYLKANLQEVIYENVSLMPVFSPERLNERDLTDVLGYLSTLRGPGASAP